jgi:stalled ribosome rescue protein Dom34
MPTHAVVWIDHQEGRTFHLYPASTENIFVQAPLHHVHRHPKGRGEAREHPDDARRYFGEVARTLDGVDAILILGPSTAKHEFSRHLHEFAPRLEARVVGIEAADHMTDGQIVARGRQRFLAIDRMS